MARIMVTTDLDLFGELQEETAVLESREEYIVPQIPIPNSTPGTPLEFKINASQDLYIDMANTILECNFKITFTGGGGVESTENVAAVNNFLNSAFSGVMVTMNGTTVVPCNGVHAWSAYLDVLTKFPSEAAESYLELAGYVPEKPSDALTEAAKARFTTFNSNGLGKYTGPILAPFFRNRKWILPRVETTITLFRNKPEFMLLYKQATAAENGVTSAKSFVVSIEKAVLWVTRKRLHGYAHKAIETALYKTPAIYNFEEITVRMMIVSKDTFSIDASLIDGGPLPKRIDIIQVGQQAATGSLSYNPLNMASFGLTMVTLEKDGQVHESYNMDTQRPYLQLFRHNGCLLQEVGNMALNYADWSDSHTILRFNLTQYPVEAELKIKPIIGTLRLKMQWDQKRVRGDAIVVLAMLIYDRRMLIDHQRCVSRV